MYHPKHLARAVPKRKITRRAAMTAVSTLGLTLAGPVTTAQAGPVLLDQCKSILQWQVPLPSIPADDVQEFLTDLLGQGIEATVAQLVAYLVPTSAGPTQVIAGTGAPIKLCPVMENGVEVWQIVAVPVFVPIPKLAPTTLDGSEGQPYWMDVTNDDPNDCMKIETERYKRWVCWDGLFQVNDHDPNNHHWQFFAQTSGAKVGGGQMTRMWIEGKPNYPTSDYQNFDGRIPKPEADWTSGEDCTSRSETITISTGSPVQIGEEQTTTRTLCERYTINMYDDEGHWAQVWHTGGDGTAGKRHVAFNMGVRTPQDSEQDNRVSWYLLTGQWVERCC